MYVHVHKVGTTLQEITLLFRDYLRTHPGAVAEYAALKYELADRLRDDAQAYIDAREPFIWTAMRAASDWSQSIGWSPEFSDV